MSMLAYCLKKTSFVRRKILRFKGLGFEVKNKAKLEIRLFSLTNELEAWREQLFETLKDFKKDTQS